MFMAIRKRSECYLCISMDGVCHPTAGFYLVGIEAPKLQLLFEEGAAHVGRVVQFTRSGTQKNIDILQKLHTHTYTKLYITSLQISNV